jgi:hypothetical protein
MSQPKNGIDFSTLNFTSTFSNLDNEDKWNIFEHIQCLLETRSSQREYDSFIPLFRWSKNLAEQCHETAMAEPLWEIPKLLTQRLSISTKLNLILVNSKENIGRMLVNFIDDCFALALCYDHALLVILDSNWLRLEECSRMFKVQSSASKWARETLLPFSANGNIFSFKNATSDVLSQDAATKVNLIKLSLQTAQSTLCPPPKRFLKKRHQRKIDKIIAAVNNPILVWIKKEEDFLAYFDKLAPKWRGYVLNLALDMGKNGVANHYREEYKRLLEDSQNRFNCNEYKRTEED